MQVKMTKNSLLLCRIFAEILKILSNVSFFKLEIVRKLSMVVVFSALGKGGYMPTYSNDVIVEGERKGRGKETH